MSTLLARPNLVDCRNDCVPCAKLWNVLGETRPDYAATGWQNVSKFQNEVPKNGYALGDMSHKVSLNVTFMILL